MHYAGNYDKASLQLPSAYETHSQGYSRVTLVDHSVGSVHMGLGICKLDRGGTLDPHVHFYEEAFYILEGQVLGSIDGRNYQFGPGDYGIIQASVPHAWRGTGDQPARWLEMLSPQSDAEAPAFTPEEEAPPLARTTHSRIHQHAATVNNTLH